MLAKTLRPMSSGIKGIPHTAIRSDAGILLTVALKYPKSFMNVLRYGEAFSESFNLDDLGLKNDFLRNYLDMLAFLLQGLPADQTLKVVMAYMVEVSSKLQIHPYLQKRTTFTIISNTSGLFQGECCDGFSQGRIWRTNGCSGSGSDEARGLFD